MAVYQIKCFQVPACVAEAAVLGVQLFCNVKQLNKEVKATSTVALEHWGTTLTQDSGMIFQASVPHFLYYFFSLYIYIISISWSIILPVTVIKSWAFIHCFEIFNCICNTSPKLVLFPLVKAGAPGKDNSWTITLRKTYLGITWQRWEFPQADLPYTHFGNSHSCCKDEIRKGTFCFLPKGNRGTDGTFSFMFCS